MGINPWDNLDFSAIQAAVDRADEFRAFAEAVANRASEFDSIARTLSETQSLASLGPLAEMDIAAGLHLTDFSSLGEAAAEVARMAEWHEHLESNTRALESLGAAVTSHLGTTQLFSQSVLDAARDAEAGIARMADAVGASLKPFESSGLFGTSSIVEQFGEWGLTRGLEAQINALASSVRVELPNVPYEGSPVPLPRYDEGADTSRLDVRIELDESPSSYVILRIVEQGEDLLIEEQFEGALDEFQSAKSRYRNGEKKEAMADALRAFESTLKTIFDRLGWRYAKNATAKGLLSVGFDNGLVSKSLQSQYAALRSLLESGLPTVSNPVRHGQGSFIVATPDHVAEYALNLCATSIIFLVRCYKAHG